MMWTSLLHFLCLLLVESVNAEAMKFRRLQSKPQGSPAPLAGQSHVRSLVECAKVCTSHFRCSCRGYQFHKAARTCQVFPSTLTAGAGNSDESVYYTTDFALGGIGSPCKANEDCDCVPGSVCSSAVCQCPPGQVYNATSSLCQCPSGQVYNATSSLCQCPAGQVYNATSSLCQCPPGQVYNATSSLCQCPPAQVYNATSSLCQCPPGQVYNATSSMCHQVKTTWASCSPPDPLAPPPYTTFCVNGNCCEIGYHFHPGTRTCLATCPNGYGDTYYMARQDECLNANNAPGNGPATTLEDCWQWCKTDPLCRSFEHAANMCVKSYTTVLEKPCDWKACPATAIAPALTYYQRNCA